MHMLKKLSSGANSTFDSATARIYMFGETFPKPMFKDITDNSL